MSITVIDISSKTDPRCYGGFMGAGDPSGIILHATGSNNEAGDISWLTHYHDNPVSVQKVIKRDGTIVKLLADNAVAWHAGDSVLNGRGDCNSYCIGYEVANNNTGEHYTAAQVEAVCQSVAYDTALYHVPDSWVSTHKAVALPTGRKTDPVGWDMAAMWKRVNEIRAQWPYPELPMWACMLER